MELLEYKGLWLLRGCLGATITAYDWQLDRITELDLDGGVADTRVFRGGTRMLAGRRPGVHWVAGQ